jgi:hypothetical protein
MESFRRKISLRTVFGKASRQMLLKVKLEIWIKRKMEDNKKSIQKGGINFLKFFTKSL